MISPFLAEVAHAGRLFLGIQAWSMRSAGVAVKVLAGNCSVTVRTRIVRPSAEQLDGPDLIFSGLFLEIFLQHRRIEPVNQPLDRSICRLICLPKARACPFRRS